MVLYKPHTEVQGAEAKKLREQTQNPPSNSKAAQTMREARAAHPAP